MLNGWGFDDAFYMTCSDDLHRRVGSCSVDTGVLRFVTGLLIIVGCTGMIYLTGALVQFINFGLLQELLGATRMNKADFGISRTTSSSAASAAPATCSQRSCARGKAQVRHYRARPVTLSRGEGDGLSDGERRRDRGERRRGRPVSAGLACCQRRVVRTRSTSSSRSRRAASTSSIQIIARGEEPSTEKKLFRRAPTRLFCPPISGRSRSPL